MGSKITNVAVSGRADAGRQTVQGLCCRLAAFTCYLPQVPATRIKPSDRHAKLLRVLLAQFVYDAWYALLTPDRDFPRELRRLMNTAFGVLAARAHKCVNLREMLLECAPAAPGCLQLRSRRAIHQSALEAP